MTHPPHPHDRIPYSSPIDGIRAIAILAVLIFHVRSPSLRGGFTGVDVFFVASGFLISSIILHDLREGSFSIREFYLRRIQRLLPNLVVMVLAVLFLWRIFMLPSQTDQAGHHAVWTLLNLSNIYIWKNLGAYWGSAAESAPLTHTWSLGVEEQFYVLFPGFLLLVARFQPRQVRSCLTGAAFLSFGLFVYSTGTNPVAAFYLLPTRLWELLIGAALAAQVTPLRKEGTQLRLVAGINHQERIGWIGLSMIILSFVFIDNGSRFWGFATLVPTVGAILVLQSVADRRTRLSHLLSSSFLVGTGKRSYSLYLWHWPLIALGRDLASLYGWRQIYGSIAGALAGIVLACWAYVGVEQPLRARGPGRTWRLAAIGVGFAVVGLTASVVASRRPVADPAHRFDTPTFSGDLYTSGKPAMNALRQDVRFYDMYFPPVPARPDSWRTGGVMHLYGGSRPRVVVLGSSHAVMYSKLIDDICREMGLSVAFLGIYGTHAFFSSTADSNFSTQREADEFDEARRRWLQEWRPEVVLVVDRWEQLIRTRQGFEKSFRSFLKEVTPIAGRVVFVSQIPVVRAAELVNLRELFTWLARRDKSQPHFYPDRNEPLRQQATAVAEAATKDFSNLRVIRADKSFYKEDGSIRYASARAFLYADDDHLTDTGADVVRESFQNAIAEACQSLPWRRSADGLLEYKHAQSGQVAQYWAVDSLPW